eukprot:scaffold37679_cov76-Cyclotella_meneghiniana.AAC.5
MPSIEPSAPTSAPTYQTTPTVGTNKTLAPTPGVLRTTFQPTTIAGTATVEGPLEGIYETIVPSNYPGPKQQSKPPSSAFPTSIQYDPGDYEYDYSSISAPPTKPWYTSNEYETDVSQFEFIKQPVEDFAEHDDFFEAKPVRFCIMHCEAVELFVLFQCSYNNQLHDLDEIMKNYSVVMRFTGSRFYATIIEPDATFDDLIPPDYHVSFFHCLNGTV